ncbi:hypothetical protein VaNZ11_000358 [Volvox africanus]|uniref:Uncharacterized protein n=1 Tax=Volvox africanus TaxID=51714 RepID=A0ABQ5RM00_9CHLO|nr:hypothetical protein VaNZ11_000358 [Volvox africanus]
MAWGQAGARGIDDLVRRIAGNDPKLTSLTILRQRRFIHDDVASFVRAMATNTNLTELYCSSHPVAPHTASLFAEMLTHSHGMRSLCVGDSSFGDDGVVELARGVAASSLTHLDLSNKGFGQRGAKALAAALAAAPSLVHLELNSNPLLGDAGLRTLCGIGEGDVDGNNGDRLPAVAIWAGLRVLEVQGCGVSAAGVRALAASPNCARLHVLRLDGNSLGPEGGAAVGELLQAASSLQELSLRRSDLGDLGGEALGAALVSRSISVAQASSGVTEPAAQGRIPLVLDLSECGLGSQSLKALQEAVLSGARLALLCLAGNTAVSDADVAAQGTALWPGRCKAESGAAVAHLDVSGTAAGPQAVSALSLAKGLRHLSMVGCPLGAGGAAALASSLRTSGGKSTECGEGELSAAAFPWAELQELCISGTGLGIEDLRAVFAALAAGGAPNLQSLEVGANPGVREDAFQELLASLRDSRPQLAVYWRSGDDLGPRVQGQ